MSTSVNWVPRRDIDENSFLDITTSLVTLSWEPDGSATALFEDALTDLEIINVKFRMGTKDEDEALLLAAMVQARTDNDAYLNLGFIGPDEVQAHMTKVCDQNTAIANLLLGPLAALTPP